MDIVPQLLFPGGWIWVALGGLLTLIVHVGFACAVYADSGTMWRLLRRNTFLVSGVLWALATLLGGVFVAAIYWVIHHSTLRPAQPTDISPRGPTPNL